ncbi:hypothetical protein [Methanobrevibacter sp.]|uniref:hypothetical protein n=1 Tax=Methanobrevibacter sp. TaxID=66852 RepID=UPI0025DE0128|nr:hypothetical protein [Methanobrevibacter sp.]MBQ2962059.1 hypothetical protein [Methanobrevibacter sp.]
MAEEKEIKCDNINYAVYKIGKWENDYEINILGTASEIPVTKPTLDHMVKHMDHIRASVFEIGGKEINGMIGLAMQFNPSFASRDIDELIELEEKEHELIMDELNSVELKGAEDTIALDTDEFVIYKLEYDGHTLSPKPYNDFAKRHQMEEIKRLKELSGERFVLNI